MARTFDGVDDVLSFSIGATNFAWGPGTFAAIVTRAADGVNGYCVSLDSATAANQSGLGVSATNLIQLNSANGARVSSLTLLASDGWALIACTKPTGTSTGRIHKYVFSTNTWSHEDCTATRQSSGTFDGTPKIGAVDAVFWNGNISIAGVWNVVLTDAQIESMAFSLLAWFQVQPKGLWLLDQDATTQKVLDLTGGGANESALTGTTIATSSVPVFSYGHDLPMVAFSQPAAGAGKPWHHYAQQMSA